MFQRRKAKGRGLSFEITYELWRKIIKMRCYLCNAAPSNIYKFDRVSCYAHGQTVVYQGIDRIDNNLGYEPENIRPCCKLCNQAKSDKTLNDFTKHIKRIANRIKKGLI